MSLVIELPASLEAELTAESERLGVSISEVVVKRINGKPFERLLESKPRTGAECMAIWDREGVMGIRKDIVDPPSYVREMRDRIGRRFGDRIDGTS